jgi:hypothetical protein
MVLERKRVTVMCVIARAGGSAPRRRMTPTSGRVTVIVLESNGNYVTE